ncbi:GNAT family N-acetyltransferase [Paenibacillus sp. YYML68]|uniref:GNAT family N-acetyltransferase n=1 Tax=Paenibacillus sp. YYML68 TaxID=2909250 RepID=UPI002492C367|nr:GNAT family N-acetyltransferase [Paenibacillus sp. YYML68]
MDYHRITHIEDPYFRQMHELMKRVFPKEEVLAYELWAEPLQDPSIRVFVAVLEGEVVGATEYRYYPDMEIAMTDFTIIGRDGLGIGPFLASRRMADLREVARTAGRRLDGMLAEIYNPEETGELAFGGVKSMNPYVRREVLAHLGYRKLELDYVHPSWQIDGEAVHGLDLCYMPIDGEAAQTNEVPASLIATFLETYYAVLEAKPKEWYEMVEQLRGQDKLRLLAI